jgi:hypothetical protein
MTAWDVLDRITLSFPPVVMALILAAVLSAVVVFIIGFGKHGFNFLKYGFKQKEMSDLSQKIDDLRTEVKGEIEGLRTEFKTELATIKVNHFGHLKNYLGILNGVLLDKEIINNETKARMDNELRGMG